MTRTSPGQPEREHRKPLRFPRERQSKQNIVFVGPHQTRDDTIYRQDDARDQDVARETRLAAHRSHIHQHTYERSVAASTTLTLAVGNTLLRHT